MILSMFHNFTCWRLHQFTEKNRYKNTCAICVACLTGRMITATQKIPLDFLFVDISNNI